MPRIHGLNVDDLLRKWRDILMYLDQGHKIITP